MCGGSEKNKMTGEKERFQRVARVARKVKAFFGQKYVWLSLTVGFLWMLSIPFIVMLSLGALGDGANQFAWIFQAVFFPLTLSLYLLSDVIAEEIWIAFYGFSFVISMLLCLGAAYIIHKIRIKIMPGSGSK